MAALVIKHAATATGSPKIGAPDWNANLQYSGEMPVTNGGTGATTGADALFNLGMPWIKLLDWTPTAIGAITTTLYPTLYRRYRITVSGVKQGSTGTLGDILYARVLQAGVTKSGATDYYNHLVHWSGPTGGAIIDTTAAVLQLTALGQNTLGEEMHGEFYLDTPNSAARGGLFGTSRYLDGNGARGVALVGNQILAGDAAINGITIGLANGGSFAAGVGSIVIEGLQR